MARALIRAAALARGHTLHHAHTPIYPPTHTLLSMSETEPSTADASTTLKRDAREPSIPADSSPKRVKLDLPPSPPPVLNAEDSAQSTAQEKEKGKGKGKRDASGWAKSRKGKEKGTKNVGRRRGTKGDGEGRDPSLLPEGAESEKDKGPRLPKRQCALLIGFCGTGCAGMQMYVLFSRRLYLSRVGVHVWVLTSGVGMG